MTRPVARLLLLLLLFVLPMLVPASASVAQEISLASAQAPRFLIPGPSESAEPVEVDASRIASLRRRVSLDLEQVRLGDALEAVAQRAGVRLVYVRSVLPLDSLVRFHSDRLTVAAALTELLFGLKVDVMVSSTGQLALVRSTALRATPGSITGKVTDAESGQAVVSAEVLLAGTPYHVTTAEDGGFRLAEIPPGNYTLIVRRIGYAAKQQQVTVGDGETVELTIALTVVATRLDELVTTVTGDQRRLELGHTVATIQADSLMQTAPVLSFGELIQGRAPGVLSLTSSNNVGQAGVIRLRGLNSFGVPNNPIVVVDGVRMEAGAGTGGQGPTNDDFFKGATTSGGFTGRLADLDPTEIASVEIVKGPSAATLYGTDAANGVLVITTKRGQVGKPRVTAFTEQGILEQRLDDWNAPWGPGGPAYAFGHSTTDGTIQQCTLLNRAAGSCVLDSLVSFNAFTNPDTRPFKNGRHEQYGLQVSGGTAGGTTYFLSGDYQQETSTYFMPPADQALIKANRGVTEIPDWQLRPNAFHKVNLRGNLTAPLGNRGSVTLATGFVSNQARQSGTSLFQVGYRDLYDGWFDGAQSRPAYRWATRNEDVVRRFLGSLATSYRLRDWLTLRGTVGADLSTNAYGSLTRRGEARPPAFNNTGGRTANQLDVARYSVDLGATATRALSAAVSSKTSLGVQYNRRAQRGTLIAARNLPLGGETIAGAADPLFAAEATLATAVAGGYVEEVLGLRDRLFFTGAMRFDGGSAFGQNFSVAAYPKASLSWLVSDGQTGPHLPGVSSLRLRAAYGASGVQPGPFDALQQISVITGLSGTTLAPAAVLGAFGNAGLKPERTSEMEAGLDLEMASGRVRLEFTGYQRTSHDALINRPVALEAGGGTRWENIGSVRNRGLELLLSADVLRGRNVSAGLTVTGSLNQNKLLEAGEGVILSSPTQEGARQDVGYPLYGLWARTVESFADANGNGIIEPDEITLTDNRFIGSNFPKREATLSPYVALFGERLRLSGLLQYRGDFYVQNFLGAFGNCRSFLQSCRAVTDASTSLADQAQAVALSQLGISGPAIEPASYLLLRELSASLTLPTGWGRALGAREARLVLAVRNPALLWRQGTSFAPENANTSGDQINVGSGGGPLTSWLLRVNLNY